MVAAPAVTCDRSLEVIEAAGLRYVDGRGPGIRRISRGKGFSYVDAEGKAIHDARILKRIRSLVIPPAWTDVWICPSPNGHIQAVGRDARGRRQYRYHEQFRSRCNEDKFGRMVAFGAVLALIRRRVARDLRRSGLPREKVLAALVRLLETTYIRVGNPEYAKENGSFGLTTLKNHHLRARGEAVELRFRGKSGVPHLIELNDRTVARVVRECHDLPGYRLFQYVDAEGNPRNVHSEEVNEYIRGIAGEEFTAKDFRTWAGTVLGARELLAQAPAQSETEAKRNIVAAVKRVAEQLRNRPATARKYYIHPAIIDAYSDGSLFEAVQQGVEQEKAYNGRGLRAEEYSVLLLITRYLHRGKVAA
jgi:DNA topoisomerase-1